MAGLPCQTVIDPNILRILEVHPLDEKTFTPMARFLLARNLVVNQSLASQRAACRFLLQNLLAITTAQKVGWNLSHSASGAPRLFFDGKLSQISVSFAHSDMWLAVGIARGARIGVDVERLTPRRDILAMVDYLGWKKPVQDLQDFYSKWTLWEASAKCVEGSMLMRENHGFERLCHTGSLKQVYSSGQWSGLHDCLDEEVCYAIALHYQQEVSLTHRNLGQQKILPW